MVTVAQSSPSSRSALSPQKTATVMLGRNLARTPTVLKRMYRQTQFPQLTPFGRRFKIGGYTLGYATAAVTRKPGYSPFPTYRMPNARSAVARPSISRSGRSITVALAASAPTYWCAHQTAPGSDELQMDAGTIFGGLA
jgi:hypothetical protein